MAQKAGRQTEWPRVYGNPRAHFLTADGYLRSDRSLAGPLRTGTELRVGPRSAGARDGDYSRTSDMGMDRVGPRDFDVLGTCRTRFGEIPSSLVTDQLSRRNGNGNGNR